MHLEIVGKLGQPSLVQLVQKRVQQLFNEHVRLSLKPGRGLRGLTAEMRLGGVGQMLTGMTPIDNLRTLRAVGSSGRV